jgi:hypothetical protein
MSFKSFEYKHLDYDQKTNKYRFEYKIVDDDWVGTGVAVAVGVGVTVGVGVGVGVGRRDRVGVVVGIVAAVIQEYSKRDLPIAPNLVRAFQWQSKKYGYSIEQIIAWNKQDNPLYKDYEEDIEKYLVLL